MKIVFDISTPKQVTFFMPMIDQFKEMGASVHLITRDYSELNILLNSFNLNASVIGKHGGSRLYDKLTNSAERILLIARYLHRIKPDAVITLSNPESSRAAFGLNIPVVCFNDAPESRFVGKLTLPLASVVCAPWVVPKEDFMKFGVERRNIYFYKALDPVIWLERAVPDLNYYKKLGLNKNKPIIVCRETEWQSSYEKHDIVKEIIKQMRLKHSDWQIINIPRYKKHKYYDTISLLKCADLLVGGGGTMCIEASYYGTPVIATRVFKCHYMQWLFDNRLALKANNVSEALKLSENIIRKGIKNTVQAEKCYSNMHFPVEEICNLISNISCKN